jgi:hypothetical protein
MPVHTAACRVVVSNVAAARQLKNGPGFRGRPRRIGTEDRAISACRGRRRPPEPGATASAGADEDEDEDDDDDAEPASPMTETISHFLQQAMPLLETYVTDRIATRRAETAAPAAHADVRNAAPSESPTRDHMHHLIAVKAKLPPQEQRVGMTAVPRIEPTARAHWLAELCLTDHR